MFKKQRKKQGGDIFKYRTREEIEESLKLTTNLSLCFFLKLILLCEMNKRYKYETYYISNEMFLSILQNT